MTAEQLRALKWIAKGGSLSVVTASMMEDLESLGLIETKPQITRWGRTQLAKGTA